MGKILDHPVSVLFLGFFLFLPAFGTNAASNSSDQSEESSILGAVINDNVAEAAELPAEGWNVNTRIEKRHVAYHGETLLGIAVMEQNPEMGKLFLDKGADVNETSRWGSKGLFGWDEGTPLPIEVEYPDVDIAELLIARGAALEHGAKVGDPTKLLQDAVDDKNVELIELLIGQGAQIKARDPRVMIGKTALERSVMRGNTDIARLLAARGAADNLSRKEATRLLFAAVEGKALFFAALAVDKGADPNARLNFDSLFEYRTPLQLACMSAGSIGEESVRGYEMVKFLIEKGGDIHIRDNDGNSLMHYSVLPYGSNFHVIDLLLKKGLDVNSRNHDGETPLHRLSETINQTTSAMEGLVKLMIKGGADINARDGNGKTPLAMAEQKKQWIKAYVLEELGAKK